MKIVRFLSQAEPSARLGCLLPGGIVDLSRAATFAGHEWIGPFLHDMRAFLAGGTSLQACLAPLLRTGDVIPVESVRLLAPFQPGARIFAHVANYVEHGREAQVSLPSKPFFFPKASAKVLGHEATLDAPAISAKLDHEVELAVVIGRTCRDVPPGEELSVVAGYMVGNDLSCRDLQMQEGFPELRASYGMNWVQGKGLDASCSLGPWLTTADEVPEASRLAIRCRINGELSSSASTADMLHSVEAQVRELSRGMTLHPGDVILTGAAPGGGLASGRFLQPGDLIDCEVHGLGVLSNRVGTVAHHG